MTPLGVNFQKSNRGTGKPEAGRRADGALGEDLALKFLTAKGYSLVERNYCIRGGELDLIMQKNGILIFAEVKMRRSDAFGHPAEAIGVRKQIKLLRAIRTYLECRTARGPWRCDLITIRFTSPLRAQVTHLENIFSD